MSNAGTEQSQSNSPVSDYRPATWMGELTGWKFAIGLFGFFATIFGANAIMAYFALSTFDGVETDDAYRKGRAYNHVLEAEAAQAALGWTLTSNVTVSGTDSDAINAAVRLQLTGPDGEPVALDQLTADFWRPTVQGMDTTLVLQSGGQGRYTGSVTLARAGIWDMRVQITAPDGTPFYHEERLTLVPGESTTP